MKTDAEPLNHAVWPSQDDPRMTPIGRWLRRFWIDEIPQLWNVLKGEMSLVGPRPERPEFVQVFARAIPKYQERHSSWTGVTGLAQVEGYAGNTSVRRRVICDRLYLRNWTPFWDWCLIGRTVLRLVRRKSRPLFDFVPGRDDYVP